MFKKLRKFIILIWLASVIVLGYYIHENKELTNPENLLLFFRSFGSFALICYIIISFIRGIFLLPSLPLVLVGVLFFPENPHFVFFISMIGILFSAILIYKFSDIMGFDEWFAEHEKNKRILSAIEKYGFPIIVLWSFAVIVPTDLICYIAGTVRYNFWKFIAAVAIGEGIIVGLIIYGGKEVLNLFFG